MCARASSRFGPHTNEADSLARPATLNPAEETLVGEALDPALANPEGQVETVSTTESSYELRYNLEAQSLLRMSIPYFPGWTAEAEGRGLRMVRVDHAFIGVVAPAGKGQLVSSYQSCYFALGACFSLLALLAAGALMTLKKVGL